MNSSTDMTPPGRRGLDARKGAITTRSETNGVRYVLPGRKSGLQFVFGLSMIPAALLSAMNALGWFADTLVLAFGRDGTFNAAPFLQASAILVLVILPSLLLFAAGLLLSAKGVRTELHVSTDSIDICQILAFFKRRRRLQRKLYGKSTINYPSSLAKRSLFTTVFDSEALILGEGPHRLFLAGGYSFALLEELARKLNLLSGIVFDEENSVVSNYPCPSASNANPFPEPPKTNPIRCRLTQAGVVLRVPARGLAKSKDNYYLWIGAVWMLLCLIFVLGEPVPGQDHNLLVLPFMTLVGVCLFLVGLSHAMQREAIVLTQHLLSFQQVNILGNKKTQISNELVVATGFTGTTVGSGSHNSPGYFQETSAFARRLMEVHLSGRDDQQPVSVKLMRQWPLEHRAWVIEVLTWSLRLAKESPVCQSAGRSHNNGTRLD